MGKGTSCSREMSSPSFCDVCDLREQSICGELSDVEMQAVVATMAHLAIKEDQTLTKSGEANEFLYVVVSGAFRMVRILADGRRQIIGFVLAGDYLGMSGSAGSDYSAEALEPSLVCRFSHGYLDDMATRHPGIKDRLIASGQSELHKAQDHIVLLGKASADERVLGFLQMVAQRTAKKPGSNRFYLPMPRQDISDYLGLRMETLSRTLAKLKKQGRIVELQGRVVELEPNLSDPVFA